ncbi:sulfurtransferase [Marmoricola sp. RAF53]|uniref:sulfurtransferase n=1 Tax=Marmoricola sp. RAF53 TaxID=3233059 RepID=UPI003F9C7CF5
MSRERVLVTPDWVEANLDAPGVVLVEVDEDADAYGRGHIAGAVGLDWRADLQHPVRRDFVDRAGFERLLSERGIANDDTVVLYGGNNNWFAAYAYWYFKIYGHADVRLLDGGRKRWELEGRALAADEVTRPVTSYVAQDADPALRAYRDDVVRGIGSVGILDVRSPAEFSGEILAPAAFPQEQPYVPGHVPTAANVPWSQAATDDGSFRGDDELRALYTAAGVDLDAGETIVYCRIGERSAHTWFVLHELLGVQNVRNYDGSWVEYGSLVGVPVER